MIVDTCRIGCIKRCIIEANLNFVWQHTSNFKTKNIMNFFLVLDCTKVFSAYEMQLLYVPGPEDPCSNIEVDFEG